MVDPVNSTLHTTIDIGDIPASSKEAIDLQFYEPAYTETPSATTAGNKYFSLNELLPVWLELYQRICSKLIHLILFL